MEIDSLLGIENTPEVFHIYIFIGVVIASIAVFLIYVYNEVHKE